MTGALLNRRTGTVVASFLEVATTRRSRRRGLLGRDRIVRGSGLLLRPCRAIHTCFMRFSIDVLFIDGSGQVVKACPDVRPWTLRACAAARAVVELPVGTIARSGTRTGDALDLCCSV